MRAGELAALRARGLADLEIGQSFAARRGNCCERRDVATRPLLDRIRRRRQFHADFARDHMLAALTLSTFSAARAGLSGMRGRWRPPTRVEAYGALFAASLACFLLAHLAPAGAVSTMLAIGGGAGCGWSWLLARALFDPRAHDALWPRLVVYAVWTTSAILIVTDAVTPLLAVIGNVNRLTSSTVLFLAFIEPLNGYRGELPKREKRFRVLFAGGYAALVAAAVLSVREFPAGSAGAAQVETIKTVCAFAALLVGCLAIWFRRTHPLTPVVVEQKPARVASTEDMALGGEIMRLMRDEEIYLVANLKVADLAAKLRQPDYRVSQAIVGSLGFANFNRLLNHFRIGRALRMLADPRLDDQPILTIAMECGFGSIGPFNRAFKDETGLTPREHRAAQ